MKIRYCVTSERSSPSSWRRRATDSGVARRPSRIRAGSPGIRWIRKKTVKLTRTSVISEYPSRFAT